MGRVDRIGVRAGISVAGLLALTATAAWPQAVPKASYVAETSFTLPGENEPGYADRPVAIDLGPDRRIHIADERGRIYVYDSLGVHQRSYGGERLDRPAAIAVAENGESYVLDSDRRQVIVYGPGGQALRTIGEAGDRGGQLAAPVDLALGPAGYVYILDPGRRGIQIFSRDGVFIRDIVPGDVVLQQPMSIAVGNDGSIYVADRRAPAHVYAFPPFTELPWVGQLPRGIAARVTYRGARFEEPVALAVNDLGSVFVLDRSQGRVWHRNRFSEQGIGQNDMLYGGIGTGRGSFRRASDIVLDGSTELMILDRELRKVERIRLSTEDDFPGRAEFEFPIRVTRGPRMLPAPLYDVGYDANGRPSLLLNVRGQAVTLLGTQPEVHTTVYGDTMNAYLPNPQALQQHFSQGIGDPGDAMMNDSIALIADRGRNRITIFRLDRPTPVAGFGDNFQDDRRLDGPSDAVMLDDGRIVIADTGNGRVKIFSSDLASLLGSFPFPNVAGIAVSPSRGIFAWDEDGRNLGRLAPNGSQFEPLRLEYLPDEIASVTFDRAGNMFLLDGRTHRVTVVQSDLSRVLIQMGAEGAFDRPERIVVDREGNIYIADGGSDRTRVYRWDVRFPSIGQLDLAYEEGAAVLDWRTGPDQFISHYEVQGAPDDRSGFRSLATPEGPPFRLDPDVLGQPPARYVRVAAVSITGTAGAPTDPLPLFNFTAAAAYEAGDYEVALQDAQEALDLMSQGQLEAGDQVRGQLLWIAFASAYELGNHDLAVTWAERLQDASVPPERRIEFPFKLAHSYLEMGNPRAASQQLLDLVGEGPRPEYFRDPAVVEMSFRVYRELANAGLHSDAIDYLRFYTRAMPDMISDLRQTYRDSITVLDTRNKLAQGFEHWNNAEYGPAVNFFESLLATGELNTEQQVVARQILAAAYYAFGRRSDAADAFRQIYTIDPDFDLQSEAQRVQRLYDLTIYSPEMRSFFRALRSGS